MEPLFYRTFCIAQKDGDIAGKEVKIGSKKLNECAVRFIYDDKSSAYDKLLKKIRMPSLTNKTKQGD